MQAPTPILKGLYFGEGPRWHDGWLWFSDMHGHRVVRMQVEEALDETAADRMAATAETVLEMDFDTPSGLGWLPDGQLLVVAMESQKLYRQELDHRGTAGALRLHADLSGLVAGDINDRVVAADGTAYVGHMGYRIHGAGGTAERKSAETIMVSAHGQASIAADQLEAPNGHILSADGRTLIVAESAAARLTAFEVGADGQLGNRRCYAALTPASEDVRVATPDGICLDEQDAVWVADPLGKRIFRVLEGGEVTDFFIYQDVMPVACVLAGADRRTLCICVAADWRREIVTQKPTGRIDAVRVSVPGAGRP